PRQDAGDRDGRRQPGRLGRLEPGGAGGSTGLGEDLARVSAGGRRRARGAPRAATAGAAEPLPPLAEAAKPRAVFDDPFAEGGSEPRPMLLIFDDGADDRVVREDLGRLRAAAAAHGVRVETLTTEADTEVARYASLVLSGRYGAEYLRL